MDWLSGALSGSANIVVGFPFDVVKVRLQTAIGSYPGAWHCFKNILKYEGVRGLYRGQTPQLLGGAIETGINYAVGWSEAAARWPVHTACRRPAAWVSVAPLACALQVYRSMLEVCAGAGSAVPGSLAIPLSAGVAGLALSFVLSPAELIKCRLQLGSTDPLHGSYKGPVDCLRHLLRTEGWRKGLWRGLGATAAREVPGNIIYFTSYSVRSRSMRGGAICTGCGDPSRRARHGGLGVPCRRCASGSLAGRMRTRRASTARWRSTSEMLHRR